MMPRPMKCGAAITGGQCEELLTISGIQYVYDLEPVEGEPNSYNLNEIHYNAICPKCGERRLIEKPTAD
jgi:hypothetical protein